MTGLWYEITAQTAPTELEAVAEAMRAVAPGGITIEEPFEILGPEQGVRLRKGEPVLVRAYLPASELGAVLTDQLRTAMQKFATVELTARPIYEQDWAVSWREFFGVVKVGRRIVIVPSWVEHTAEEGQIPIRLDPGRAFGTGHHETTRLCLEALEEVVQPGMHVLDVGTGSGILAIAAVKLGARKVDAFDVDPVAVEVAAENCRQNRVADAVQTSKGTLAVSHATTYPLVVANISADANIGLAGSFARVVEAGGLLLVSGMLVSDAQHVTTAIEEKGFRQEIFRDEREWCLIGFHKS